MILEHLRASMMDQRALLRSILMSLMIMILKFWITKKSRMTDPPFLGLNIHSAAAAIALDRRKDPRRSIQLEEWDSQFVKGRSFFYFVYIIFLLSKCIIDGTLENVDICMRLEVCLVIHFDACFEDLKYTLGVIKWLK